MPFDLKQKRVLTYSLSKGEDKASARKELCGKLTAALRDIVKEHQAAVPQATAGQPSTENVVEAIRGNRADQAPLVMRFSERSTEEIKKLDRRGEPGAEDDALVRAIGEAGPLVDEFGRVAQAAAEMNASESARALFLGLERLLALYEIPRGTTTGFRDWDFDLFKFVGHEICTVLFAHLRRAGRWALIDAIANERLYQDPPSGQAGHVGGRGSVGIAKAA